MTGTLAGALAARKIPTRHGTLSSEVEGFIENVDGKPLITKIKVHYMVRVPKGKREEALRAIEVHEGLPRLSVSSAGHRHRMGRRGARGGVTLTA